MLNEGYVSTTRPGPIAALSKASPELASISGDAWREALAVSPVVSCPAGTNLLDSSDSTDKFIIVLQGVVKIYQTSENGREIALHRVYAGQICIPMLVRLLHRSTRCAQAVAEEDTRLLAISPDHFDRLLAESEGFGRYLMSAMAHCISDVMQLVADVSFNHLDLRLAQLIGQLSSGTGPGKLKLTHQAIANELGTTREVVSRILKRFERAGYIKLNRGNIDVIAGDDLEKLYQLRQVQ
jgi:CRP/FNR family transcriptional regulator